MTRRSTGVIMQYEYFKHRRCYTSMKGSKSGALRNACIHSARSTRSAAARALRSLCSAAAAAACTSNSTLIGWFVTGSCPLQNRAAPPIR